MAEIKELEANRANLTTKSKYTSRELGIIEND